MKSDRENGYSDRPYNCNNCHKHNYSFKLKNHW